MTWMLTATGSMVDLRLMEPSSISLLDVAHHLAQLNRFTGACKRPISVAEHSLMVTEILEREHGERQPGVLLTALMHDAHEAYTNDLSQPMKELLGEANATDDSGLAAKNCVEAGSAGAHDDGTGDSTGDHFAGATHA